MLTHPIRITTIPAVAFAATFTGAASARDTDAADRARLIPFISRAPVDGPLVGDRPDFTESTDAVARGWVQIEAGYTFTYDGGAGGSRTHSAPELLMRVGLATGVELRIAWPTYTRVDASAGDADGLEDFGLGVKIKLIEQSGVIPHFGVIAEFSAPTGADALSSDGYDPTFKLLWAYDLTERVGVSGNINFSSLTEGDDRFFQAAASVALGVALTDRIGAYVEYFGFYPAGDNADDAHSINTGLTYLFNNNFQVDARVGWGLNGQADDFFAGAGFAWRF